MKKLPWLILLGLCLSGCGSKPRVLVAYEVDYIFYNGTDTAGRFHSVDTVETSSGNLNYLETDKWLALVDPMSTRYYWFKVADIPVGYKVKVLDLRTQALERYQVSAWSGKRLEK